MVVEQINVYTFTGLAFKFFGEFLAGIVVFENIEFYADVEPGA